MLVIDYLFDLNLSPMIQAYIDSRDQGLANTIRDYLCDKYAKIIDCNQYNDEIIHALCPESTMNRTFKLGDSVSLSHPKGNGFYSLSCMAEVKEQKTHKQRSALRAMRRFIKRNKQEIIQW